jgi:uncharacterized membrane protein YkvI
MTARLSQILMLLLVSVSMGGCQAIADIFQAGIWVGVIIVVAIVAIVGFLMSRGRRG